AGAVVDADPVGGVVGVDGVALAVPRGADLGGDVARVEKPPVAPARPDVVVAGVDGVADGAAGVVGPRAGRMKGARPGSPSPGHPAEPIVVLVDLLVGPERPGGRPAGQVGDGADDAAGGHQPALLQLLDAGPEAGRVAGPAGGANRLAEALEQAEHG